jgi:hypothetical protein
VPFFVMKSALFVQANVDVKTKLTSKVPFLFGNFDVLKKISSKACNFGIVGKKIFLSSFPQHFLEKMFWCPFQYPKVPLEASAPPPPIF